jgi:hypothetical protein
MLNDGGKPVFAAALKRFTPSHLKPAGESPMLPLRKPGFMPFNKG